MTERAKTSPGRKTANGRINFYNKVLSEADKLDFETVSEVEGIDDEIAILRLKIKAVLATDPKNVRLILAATNALGRLIKTRHDTTKAGKKSLKEAFKTVITEIAVPVGAAVLKKKIEQ